MAPLSESPSGSLRSAVREDHERLDTSDYAVAIERGTLPIARYASYLRAVYVLHDGLEQLVELSGSSVLRAAFAAGPTQRERLERDLAHLNVDKHGVDVAALHALVLVQRLRLAAGPSHWLGAIYVLEGSQLGGLVQARALASRPELQHGGLAYLSGSGPDTRAALRDLFALLDEQLRDPAALAAAIAGAKEMFAGFEAILSAVMAGGERPAEALNADAGAHPLPRDAREVSAALIAGERTRRDVSYYEARYGERGARFTRSDSAWLVTLTHLPRPEALRQVRWLARVLAARGMPRLLLERHLEQLHSQLCAELPENRADYAVLLEAAASLAQERRAHVSDAQLEQLVGELENSYRLQPGGTPPLPLREAGFLLLAAVLDEACGVPHAVESLCRWLTDTSRASQGFRVAVEHTLRSARDAVAGA